MSDLRPYFEHSGKVISADNRFKHVMAITLDPSSENRRGIARCITSRTGDLSKKDTHNRDRSELHLITGDTLEQFTIGERLSTQNEQKIIDEMLANASEPLDFIGLEDPDIWIDQETTLMHVYFTIPLIPENKALGSHSRVSLGHAVGTTLDTLKMTVPALAYDRKHSWIAKEVCIVPKNSSGTRLNLVESSSHEEGRRYSTVRVAIANDMGAPWQFGELAFHPGEHALPWVAKDASPGPLFSPAFLDVGAGKAVGIMNGREADYDVNGETLHGIFSVGLFIYDYEHGKIDWVSPEPLIRDSEAEIITFASQFVETKPGEGILYAHVDDLFVRAYTLCAEGIRALLP